jgi:hypothetical protein
MAVAEAPNGGRTAPGVEQIVVVLSTTVVEVRKTVEPAGQSGAAVQVVVNVLTDVMKATTVVVAARSRRSPVQS